LVQKSQVRSGPISVTEKAARLNNGFLEPVEDYGPGRDHSRKSRAMTRIAAFLKNESGATAIEYGLIAAGISIAIIAVVNGLGTQLNNTFTSVSTQLK